MLRFADMTWVMFFLLVETGLAANMNGKPGQYKVANLNTESETTFSTDYKAEYFEVYSQPIKSQYSEVYWRHQDPVELPADIKARFQDKVMAIVGYEVNQVRVTPSGDIPVPITWAYNHHYVAWLANSRKVKFVKKSPEGQFRGVYHGTGEVWLPELLEDVEDIKDPLPSFSENLYWQVFSEANGGEFRMSYHGYPKGYAQLISGPDQFQLMPMQIDTWNRDMTGPKYMPGPLPKSSRIPHSAGYSGLLECPCSDRLDKVWGKAYALNGSSECEGGVEDASACFAAAEQLVAASRYIRRSVVDRERPPGCSVSVDESGVVDAVFNAAAASSFAARAAPGPKVMVAFAHAAVNVTVALSTAEGPSAATVTLEGPADRWFGVGFGASSMCVHMSADECDGGGPYAIIVSGEAVSERRLDFHGPGKEVARSVTVEESGVVGGVRRVVLSRALKGASAEHFSFDPAAADATAIITARGCGVLFAQHCAHASAALAFLAAETPTGVCDAGIQGSIGGVPFAGGCAPFPKSELLAQRNPTCAVQSYAGGLHCCRDGHLLLDKAQAAPWPGQPLEYHLKFRFYFEEFRAPTPSAPPSHLDLVRVYWQTEAWAGEYDVVQCAPHVPRAQCVHQISSRWTVRDMLPPQADAQPDKIVGIKLVYAGPHCHAPSCLSMELFNAATGRLICRVQPDVGKGSQVLDEEGFVAIPPCLWGSAEEGLTEPEVLSVDTPLLSIKRNNNTLPHTGEMASWQMRAVVLPRTPQPPPPVRTEAFVLSRHEEARHR